MEWLNYHHLLYFWLVAKEGSLARASAALRLAPSTVSGQIRALEQALGEKLFARSGRRLVPTEIGRVVFRYAQEIFALGGELQDVLKGRSTGRPLRLMVGVADVVPKRVARRLLAPALELDEPVRILCREDKPDRLLAELAVHDLDIVIADAPVGPSTRIRAFSHLLAECGVVFCAVPKLAAAHRRGFPASLDGAPLLLPAEGSTLRRSLDQWFALHSIQPRVVGEFDDSALLKVFGQAGHGIFPVPAMIADEVQRQYQVRRVGRADRVRERFYAISVDRKLKHPAVIAISEAARRKLVG
ncbi:MAG TPA: transcriptional activator NhaR [Polyangiales bacterium]|nr:transcriptional activator NhaR [Polyangiales bacterium]